jgi:hypothetical protein
MAGRTTLPRIDASSIDRCRRSSLPHARRRQDCHNLGRGRDATRQRRAQGLGADRGEVRGARGVVRHRHDSGPLRPMRSQAHAFVQAALRQCYRSSMPTTGAGKTPPGRERCWARDMHVRVDRDKCSLCCCHDDLSRPCRSAVDQRGIKPRSSQPTVASKGGRPGLFDLSLLTATLPSTLPPVLLPAQTAPQTDPPGPSPHPASSATERTLTTTLDCPPASIAARPSSTPVFIRLATPSSAALVPLVSSQS